MFEQYLPQFKQTGLFNSLQDEDIIGMMPCFSASETKCIKGDILFQAGDRQTTIGIVVRGEIHIQKEDYAGNRFLVNVLSPGDMFGEVSAFANIDRWANTVLAGDDSSVVFIRVERISKPCCRVCASHQVLIENMLKIVARKALHMNSRINYLKLRGMREKLANFLMEQSLKNGRTTFDLPMNREALADFLNVSRPSMSRELGRMRDEGIIDFYRSSFVIKNVEALKQMI
ncbi:MAG: Crp/Fnr family transcriptional regulator [Clostridiaceae bacterium]|nr:Crp/Fnr family transcriptional regulator [Clostridiaceae bacterium]